MEDPWGSPWATNDTNTALEPAPPRSTLELPGRTLARQRSFTTQSPWATDDDGSSDWGTADSSLALPIPAPTSGGSIWGAWGGGGENGPNSSQTQLTPRAREGSLSQGQSSPAWPAATSPGLVQGKTLSRRNSARSLYAQPSPDPAGKTLSRRSSARSLFGHPSPDPWSADAQNRLSLPLPALISAEQVVFSTLDRHDEEEEVEEEENEKVDTGKGTKDGPQPVNDAEEKIESPGATQPPEEDQRVDSKPDTQAADYHPKSPSRSRHSSVSDRSQRNEHPDSPITSMDEDSKDRPQSQRRPSTRVQESVGTLGELEKKHGDALAVPDPTRGRRRSTSQGAMSIRSVITDCASDFGDFEDAQSSNSAPPSRRPSYVGSPRPTSPGATRTRSLSRSSLPGTSISKVAEPPAIPEPEVRVNQFQKLRDKFGPLKFTPDLKSTDKLFDVAKLDAEQPSAKDFSLDHIDGVINDSFTSISERKTWWRISRHGTMRKHDSGDDDNYRRITWATSKMREETNTIVRRWMEDGSYTGGRPSFGDVATVKGGAFNWNSRAEPLSMDQVFGTRKSTQHLQATAASIPRPLSLQPQAKSYAHSRDLSIGVKSLPPRSPGTNSLPPPSPSPLSIPGPLRSPAFGWSTATGSSTSETPGSSLPASRTVRRSIEVTSVNSAHSRSIAASIHEPESRTSLQLAHLPVPPSVSPDKQTDPIPEVDDGDDDDDDWGEMVISPPSATRPVSSFFDVGNSSLAELAANKPASSAPTTETSITLDAVSSKLEQGQTAIKAEAAPTPPPAPAAHVWDFSAFDVAPQVSATPSSPMVPSIPPTTTSKPEFEFDTPLQSPALSGPSRTASPMSAFQLSKPPTPTVPTVLSRTSSIASFRNPQPTSTTPTALSRPSSIGSFQAPQSPTPTVPAVLSRTSSIGSFQPPQPPTPTMPTALSRTSSIASFQLPQPPASMVPPQPQHASKPSISSTISNGLSRPSSPAALQMSKPPTSPVPFIPQHTQRSSLSMGRPSPLQKVLTPNPSSPQPMSPAIASPLKSMSFAHNNSDEGVLAKRIVDELPDLSYMLR